MATHDHMAHCATGEGAPALSRRSLLPASPALLAPALLAGPALASADSPILALFREWDALQVSINSASRSLSDEEFDASMEQLRAIEARTMALPVTSAQDLAAKIVMNTDYGSFDLEEFVITEYEAIMAEVL